MKQFLLILTILFSSISFGQNPKTADSLLNSKLNALNTHIADLEKKIETERNINDKTFNSISTQISAASLTLTIMGIVFAIIAIIVGVYVTYVERKIIKIGEENKELLTKNERIKKDVEELNKLIQGDIQGLFSRLKRQETIDLLDRLTRVPKDISNICSLLLSRDLQTEDFDRLKKAYKNLNPIDGSYKDSYKLLFFQHFLTNTLKDDDLRNEILDFIPSAIQSAFENDILKSTHDFVVAIVDKGINNFKKETTEFFKGLSSSQHKDYDAVYTTIFDTLKNRQNRFDFLNLVDSNNETRIAKIAFGKLLINEYSEKQPTETESLAITNIKELEAQLSNDLEEAKQKAEAERIKQEEARRLREERQRQQQEKQTPKN